MKKYRLDLHIEAEFGSSFQDSSARTALGGMITAWSNFYGKTHKNNKIFINGRKIDLKNEITK